MMVKIPRRYRRRLVTVAIALLTLFTIWHGFVPYDSTFRLAVQFNTSRFANSIRNTFSNRDAWLQKPARYPLDLRTDVGYLIKTGYGTRQRVPALLEAYKRAGDFLGVEAESYLVLGDWTGVNETDNALVGAKVHDAIKSVISSHVEEKYYSHQRFQKYHSMQKAIESGNEEEAMHLAQSFGWELDALKFILGLELIYFTLPKKKWYIILDDDTFMIKPSLELFLSHLNPEKPQYIGNAVGDFKARFGHGGSGVIVSHGAMLRLFDLKAPMTKAYYNSLDETWGDRLVATTLQEVGVYIEERYNHHLNGEPPEITRITLDRFCSPLLSFHGLRKPGAMVSVGHALAHIHHPILWGELWQHFGSYPIENLESETIQKNTDHVGPVDDKVRQWVGIKSAEACRQKCTGDCMAWTWEEQKKNCLVSPWMVIGADGAEDKSSGVNWPKVQRLLWECS